VLTASPPPKRGWRQSRHMLCAWHQRPGILRLAEHSAHATILRFIESWTSATPMAGARTKAHARESRSHPCAHPLEQIEATIREVAERWPCRGAENGVTPRHQLVAIVRAWSPRKASSNCSSPQVARSARPVAKGGRCCVKAWIAASGKRRRSLFRTAQRWQAPADKIEMLHGG